MTATDPAGAGDQAGDGRGAAAASGPVGAGQVPGPSAETWIEARILVLSDTHVPRKARDLPPAVWAAARQADLILHAGDLVTLALRDRLAQLAPVLAVQGNVDDDEAQRQLPQRVWLRRGGVRIGMTHGHRGRASTTPGRALEAWSPAEVDVVIFGHSHRPLIERRGRLLLVNPGSPTDRRRTPWPTFAWLYVGHGQARAELVRCPSR